jgi:uncharacterized surface protein with fasciclin (FAS1) repeats
MKYNQLFIIPLLASTLLLSCKDDVKEKEVETVKEEIVKTATKTLTPVQSDRANSIWSKIAANKDTKNFARLLVSAGLSDTLYVTSSNFTVFAPNNESFSVFTEKMNITNNPDRKEELATLLKNNIIRGTMNSADLVQSIKKNKKVALTTLSGEKITATMSGDTIVLTNKNGTKAIVIKSDIVASNGTMHLVNAVLK